MSLFRSLELSISGCLKNIHFADGINIERNSDGIIASICTVFLPTSNSPIELKYFSASGTMYVDNWDRVFSTWTLTSASLTAIFIDYDEFTIHKFKELVKEMPSRALQPLLIEYIFISRLFVGFHNRQTDEINSMYEFVGLTIAILIQHPLIQTHRNGPSLNAPLLKA